MLSMKVCLGYVMLLYTLRSNLLSSCPSSRVYCALPLARQSFRCGEGIQGRGCGSSKVLADQMSFFSFPVFNAESCSVSFVNFRRAATSLSLLVASSAVSTLLVSVRFFNAFLSLAVAVARHAIVSTVSCWYETEFA